MAASTFSEGNGSETGGMIGHAIRNDQFAIVEESTTGIDDVRHVAFTLLLVRFQQRFRGGGRSLFQDRRDRVENAPIQYFRKGPTPWLRTSQPASVSMGDPQFPSWTNSQGEHRF